jgi:predicted ATPase
MTLNRLPRRQSAELTGQVAHGKRLPPEVVAQVVAKTDGVPLFVEELTKMVLESGLLQEREEHYELSGPLPSLAIPTTLHDSLMARLDRLAAMKDLAQLGATLGREFSYELLQAVAPWDEDTLHRGLHQFVAAEFLYQRGVPPQATYRFKHALIQEAAYQSLLKSTRQQYHQRVAPEVEQAYTQAYALCQQVGETPELAPVLYGLWRFYLAQVQLHTAREIGDTLLRLAQDTHDPALAVVAHYTLGCTLLFLGALPAARMHLGEGIARYTPDQRRVPVFRIGYDPGVACRGWVAVALWWLGYPDQALACAHEALELAHALLHPLSLAYARGIAAVVSQCRRDVPAVHEHAEVAVALATAQGFPFLAAWLTSVRGWALAMQDQGEEGRTQVRQGIATWQATGAVLLVPYLSTLLMDVSAHLGRTEDSLQALVETHTLIERHEERCWEAEVYRLQGVLLLRQTGAPPAEAETWLQRALDVARRQEAKSLELRAGMSLDRLWH